MKAIIIGAGRGQRLRPKTDTSPKCFTEIGGRRILDCAVDALAQNGITDIAFVGGYLIDVVKREYPQFTYYHNTEWERNNILASLMYAKSEMDAPFICSYSDILYTPEVIARLLKATDDVALAVDTNWLERYTGRTQHPTDDAEKVTVSDGYITRIHRDIDEDQAHGEFIGMAKFSRDGALVFKKYYYKKARSVFQKAYLIHLMQYMIEEHVLVAHVDTPGGYMEIDTLQDVELAAKAWRSI